MALQIVPITFRNACEFVDTHHRHHTRPRGHKFSIAVMNDQHLVGVIMVGRPVARHFDDGLTAEVLRSCTDGTSHANSMLYGAARRAASAMGYTRIITYTQAGESGASLRAAGWQVAKHLAPRAGWDTTSRPRTNKNDHIARVLWHAHLSGR
jgi:hypothetical protein